MTKAEHDPGEFDAAKLSRAERDTLHIHCVELRANARRAIALLEQVFDAIDKEPRPGQNWINTSREPVDLAADALRYAASISRGLQGRPGPKARPDERRYHVRRGQRLSWMLRGLDLTAIHDRSVRDSFEHFDEHLDRLAIRYAERPGLTVLYNVSFWARGYFPEPVQYCRALIGSERTFLNMGKEVRLAPIYDAMVALERFFSSQGDAVMADGGLILAPLLDRQKPGHPVKGDRASIAEPEGSTLGRVCRS